MKFDHPGLMQFDGLIRHANDLTITVEADPDADSLYTPKVDSV
jgi:hypothetical protein